VASFLYHPVGLRYFVFRYCVPALPVLLEINQLTNSTAFVHGEKQRIYSVD